MKVRMNMKFIGFYDIPTRKNFQGGSLAAFNKINYIIHTMSSLKLHFDMISVNWRARGARFLKYNKGENLSVTEQKNCKLMSNFESSNKIIHRLGAYYSLCLLTVYLLCHCSKGEVIIVYHSPWLYLPLKIVKKIKRIKLILEVEEIYADVGKLPIPLEAWEMKLIALADKYIISSKGLSKKIKNNEYVLCSGIYSCIEREKKGFSDNKIHLVYAGIVDKVKKGAFNAVEASLYLPANYVIHILGSGSDLEELRKMIVQYSKQSECMCIYEGVLTGEDFLSFCYNCDIGLSTQNISGDFVETSFPSKILTYLSCGLTVVSSKLQAIEDLNLEEIIYTYSTDNPKDIASTILKINSVEKEIIWKSMERLDNQFKSDIIDLLR